MFKKDKFKITHVTETLNFDEMNPYSKNSLTDNTETKQSVSQQFNKSHYTRNNSALIVHLLFQPNPESLPITLVVANTHIYWNPSCEEVKFMQISHVLHRLSQIKRGEVLPLPLPGIPLDCGSPKNIFLCGDLNSVPQSNVVKFITRLEEPDASKVEP